ncbi:hypothetical protein OK348_01150 [Flavobacterium sp. MXW15]|uniref:Phospholipase n=1 Tax=Xanthomonas chitinilytica TaxID=2989819 RepID=A0ABT3JUU1_9XANT|nr:XVIPCD domain-containing protein [Xanthomonas sp. H13-6]MCW4453410.1 hypothetical protein [Flavobacterium sp. MXW15]MCW4472237.1 phospholipase [Xanthomonas sp. H13-6]
MEQTTTTGNGTAPAMSGTTPQPADLEFPAVLKDLYQLSAARRDGQEHTATALPGGWTRLEDAELRAAGIDPSALRDARSGFDAAFYRAPDGKVALALCGTDQLRDWPQNIGQGLGLETAQFENAIHLARSARNAFGNDLVLTGHSLGGGLASAAALVTDTPAITYNASGVHNNTLEREGLDPAAAKEYAAEGLIRSYHVKNELLTHLQEKSLPLRWVMPDAIGHRIELPDPEPLSFGKRLIPGAMLKHRLDLHGIDAVMDAQDLQQLRARETAQQNGIVLPATTLSTGGQLFNDAVDKLEPQRQRLGLEGDSAFFNTAGSIAAQSGGDGLTRIDHLLPGEGRVFAVQGELADPAHRRSHIDLAPAMETPLQQNLALLQQQDAHQQTVVQQETQRRQLAMG